MKKIYLVLSLFILIVNSSCEKENCSGAEFCTADLRMILVQVKSSTGQPVILDKVYTIRKKTGEKLTLDQNMTDGWYYVLDDSHKKKVNLPSEVFEFVGIKKSKKVVSELYTVSADKCHINKVDGKQVVIAAD